ncbi:MAG: menaquinone-dependent protoporphyrinogen IX dehydrogenase, partial [Gammaproteobacteria bacterium]|nr:menaquinone-dependent protoporphyrinogen IX dehydrogenase [Gammaproteobacteria bacterium]
LDYPKYTYIDRQMIRLIMWMTKEPTAPDTVVEFTDWDKVDKFGRLIGEI